MASRTELAAAASGVVTSYTAGEPVEAYLVTVLSGTAFSFSAFEFANGRALVSSTLELPVATINGGLAPPFRPVPLSLSAEVRQDSTAFLIHGLGFAGVRRVSTIPAASPQDSLRFLLSGDTLARVTIPTRIAATIDELRLAQSDHAATTVAIGDLHDQFLAVLPYRVLVILRDDSKLSQLLEVDGVLRVETVGPTESIDPAHPLYSMLEDFSKYRVLAIRLGTEHTMLLARLRSLPQVREATLLTRGPRPATEPNDPFWAQQWNLHEVSASFCGGFLAPIPNSSIGVLSAWELPHYPPDVRIGIIDTGRGHLSIDASQEDPAVPPISYAPDDPVVFDDLPPGNPYSGHGTAVTSIAAARTNNGHGLAAPALDDPFPPDQSLAGIPVALKWYGYSQGDWGSITACINHVANHPTSDRIRAANMSIDGTEPTPADRTMLIAACKNAFLKGKLLIASAGNHNDSVLTYPAAVRDYVLAVGACLWNNLYWTNVNASPFVPQSDSGTGSTWGSWVDLVAPGGRGIVAARNRTTPGNFGSDYYSLSNCNIFDLSTWGVGGTSASAPLVTGTAAWLIRLRPSLTSEDAGQVILRTCTDMGAPGFDVRFGNGRLNAAAAAAFVSSPNWVHHGMLGADGYAPLLIQPDSTLTTLILTTAEDLGISSGAHSCVRYRLAGQADFDAGFVQAPTVWARRAETRGISAEAAWDDDERAPWAGLSGVTPDGATLETYVYRILDAENRWYPSPPELARIAYTAIGPSATLSASRPHLDRSPSIRFGRRPDASGMRFVVSGLRVGVAKLELFDVAGRRVAVLWQGQAGDGDRVVEWDGKGVSGAALGRGVYVCRLTQLGVDVAKRLAWY